MKHSIAAANASRLFFTADQHYHHRAICRFANRPFSGPDEMNEEFVKRHNAIVPKDGIVYHLGDFSLGTTDQALAMLARLNGTHHFVFGNHDKSLTPSALRHFASANQYLELRVEDADGNRGTNAICLMHYPIEVWDKQHHGSWHLHGHVHGVLPEAATKRLDVGVDGPISGYAPVSYARVKAYVANRTGGLLDGSDR